MARKTGSAQRFEIRAGRGRSATGSGITRPKTRWDGKDGKSAYAAEDNAKRTEDAIEAQIHMLAQVISAGFGKVRFVPLHSADASWIMEQVMLQDWAHGKMMTKEEAVEQGLWPGDTGSDARKPS